MNSSSQLETMNASKLLACVFHFVLDFWLIGHGSNQGPADLKSLIGELPPVLSDARVN